MHKKLLLSLDFLPKSLNYAIALSVGITISRLNIPIELMVAGSFLVIAIVKTRKRKLALCLYSACLISGATLYKLQLNRFLHFEDRFCNKTLDVRGVVLESKIDNTRAYKNKISLKVSSIKLDNQTVKEDGVVQLGSLNDTYLQMGQEVEIKNILLYRSSDPEYRNYLIRSNILNSTFTSDLKYKRIKKAQLNILTSSLCKIKDRISKSTKLKLNTDTLMFYDSIFMGDKQELSQCRHDYVNNFGQWGIAHILARSGLHLSILIFLFEIIFKMSFINFWIQRIIALLFMLIFYAISTPAAPFMRAFYMYILHDSCAILKLPINTLHLFCLTTIIMLLTNPIEIFFLDFQLSFGITLILLLWAYKFSPKK